MKPTNEADGLGDGEGFTYAFEEDTSAFFESDEFKKSFRMDGAFRIHVMIAAVLSFASFGGWFFLELFFKEYMWFSFVWGFFIWTIAVHFYIVIQDSRWLQLHFVTYLDINLVTFLLWIATDTYFPWFTFPLAGLSIPLIFHYFVLRHPTKKFLLALAIYGVFNTFVFLMNVEERGRPWFLFSMLITGLPLIVTYWYIKYPTNSFILHLWLGIDVQLIIFFTWALLYRQNQRFPWFIFVLAVWLFILHLHYQRHKEVEPGLRKRTFYEEPPQPEERYSTDGQYTQNSNSDNSNYNNDNNKYNNNNSDNNNYNNNNSNDSENSYQQEYNTSNVVIDDYEAKNEKV